MNKKIKFGVIGVGVPTMPTGSKALVHYFVPSIAWSRYFPQITKHPNAELTAICDIIPERMEEVKKVYPVKETYTNYKDLLERSDVDVVIITTPNKFHYQMAIDAIRAGKHVIIEKPIALSSKEAREIIEEAMKRNLKVMPMPWVFDDCFYKLSEMISKGLLGKVGLLEAKLAHVGPGHAAWFWKKDFGSGVVFDLGVYPVTTMTGLMGPVKRVLGLIGTVLKKRAVETQEIQVEVEDNAVILLDFGDGVIGKVSVNYITHALAGPSLEIYGSEGVASVDERGYLKFLTTELGVRGFFTSLSVMTTQFPNEPIVEQFIKFLTIDADLRAFNEQQIHVIEVLEKAIESAKDGKVKELTTTFDKSELFLNI
jgi:predicted dehydrogenase